MTHAPSSHDDTPDTSAMTPSPGPIESGGHADRNEQPPPPPPPPPQEQREASYTCRRCRSELFTESHLEPHATGAQAIARRKKGDLGSGGCTSLFLNEAAMESLPWLQVALVVGGQKDGDEEDGAAAGVEGKLCCPNARCRTRLGGFNWSGSQCSCGSWVVPAVQVVASRVDRKDPKETSGMLVVDFFAGAKAGGGGVGGGGGK